jgi:hypothetical protein
VQSEAACFRLLFCPFILSSVLAVAQPGPGAVVQNPVLESSITVGVPSYCVLLIQGIGQGVHVGVRRHSLVVGGIKHTDLQTTAERPLCQVLSYYSYTECYTWFSVNAT